MENKIKVFFSTICLLFLIGVVILVFIDDKRKEAGQDECEHSYVQVSKYSHWHGSYYHIQKCTKCGKEFK